MIRAVFPAFTGGRPSQRDGAARRQRRRDRDADRLAMRPRRRDRASRRRPVLGVAVFRMGFLGSSEDNHLELGSRYPACTSGSWAISDKTGRSRAILVDSAKKPVRWMFASSLV